jgi:GntR family transcriptional regulator
MPPSRRGLIAADLATAIHLGLIRPGERLPSQTHLMRSYAVAMGTAAAALASVTALQLAHGEPGRGTFAADIRSGQPEVHPVAEIFAASSVCRTVAATAWPKNADPVIDLYANSPWRDADIRPHRLIDVSALVAMDQYLLRWMSDAFISGARSLVAGGEASRNLHEAAGDPIHLLEAAHAILRPASGRRPAGQQPIARYDGDVPEAQKVASRIWREQGRPPNPDEPPF